MGTRVAQSVKHPTIDFGSGHGLIIIEIEPHAILHTEDCSHLEFFLHFSWFQHFLSRPSVLSQLGLWALLPVVCTIPLSGILVSLGLTRILLYR